MAVPQNVADKMEQLETLALVMSDQVVFRIRQQFLSTAIQASRSGLRVTRKRRIWHALSQSWQRCH